MTRLLSCALLGVLLLPCPALAGILVPKEPGAEPLKVRKEILKVQVRDQVARATVDQVFENLSDKPLEGTYLLPLPEGAAISGFATWVDGRRIESKVQEKEEARQTYQQAKEDRAQPALLEQSDPDTFKTRVDGIPAHGTKRVEASFAQILPYDSGVVTMRLPLAVKGRSGSEPVGSFRFEATVEDQKKIAELKVLSHAAKIERTGPGAFSVLIEGSDVRPDHDLVVTYRTESSRLGLSFVPYRPEGSGDGYFLLLASPQELTSAQDIVLKDVVFVFDTSGSMLSENKIQQAREALKKCLGNLNAEDRFGIVAFSDSTNPFRNGLVEATPKNVQEAMAFSDGLSAGGGTDIHGALTKGLDLLGNGERPRVLIFMTDGQPTVGVTDESAISQRLRERNNALARLFAFGVGSDVNRTFLERIAKENRGSQDFVERGQSIDEVVGGFYAKIARPVLSDLAFSFGEVTTVMQYPDVLPDLYKGSQLVVVGRYRGSGTARSALIGDLNGKKLTIPFSAEFPEREEENAFVARLWAQRRIDYLMSQNRLLGEREEAKTEIIALSKAYNILTPYTSMVAVRPDDQRVAAVYPSRVKPGDPTVWVRAPRDARSVTVFLPFGEKKAARWDEDRGFWSVRFLVPPGTPDGTYPIRVEIEQADGAQEQLALSVSIDTTAPVLTASASSVAAGENVALSAMALVSPSDIAGVLASREDRVEGLKALFDLRRVQARLWDGREIELSLAQGGMGFEATAETPRGLAAGRYPVVFTAQDYAGNQTRAVAYVEVR